MSKWTLEKILACEEIKFGVKFIFNNEDGFLVLLRKNNYSFYFVDEQGCVDSWDSEAIAKYDYKFYHPDMSEILPPKDKKKIKVEAWVNVYPDGQQAAYSSKWAANSNAFPDRLVCEYLEKEVEVDCE